MKAENSACLQCGCCSNIRPKNSVRVFFPEERAIVERALKKIGSHLFVDRQGIIKTSKSMENEDACPALEGSKCLIHEEKPVMCKAYPILPIPFYTPDYSIRIMKEKEPLGFLIGAHATCKRIKMLAEEKGFAASIPVRELAQAGYAPNIVLAYEAFDRLQTLPGGEIVLITPGKLYGERASQ